MNYEVEINESAFGDLAYIKKTDRNVILDAIEQQLTATPSTPTRNRKPLRPNDLSPWELRVGVYRAFYDIDEDAKKVLVKAIGWKEHNRLLIRGKEYTL